MKCIYVKLACVSLKSKKKVYRAFAPFSVVVPCPS